MQYDVFADVFVAKTGFEDRYCVKVKAGVKCSQKIEKNNYVKYAYLMCFMGVTFRFTESLFKKKTLFLFYRTLLCIWIFYL